MDLLHLFQNHHCYLFEDPLEMEHSKKYRIYTIHIVNKLLEGTRPELKSHQHTGQAQECHSLPTQEMPPFQGCLHSHVQGEVLESGPRLGLFLLPPRESG